MTKVLSVQQPWSWAILHAGKIVENRSWRTRHRGPLLIHASLRPDPQGREFMARLGIDVPEILPRGVLLGSVVLADIVDDSPSPWAMPGSLHWLLEDPRPWPEPVPAKGDLGLWDWAEVAG
jgi:ASCH domain